MSDGFWALDATGQAELVRRREVTPSELVEVAIARIEKHDGVLNAVIHRRFEAARQEAASNLPNGPFHGVPFLFKDYMCASSGDPYHCGMAFLKEHGWRSPQDSFLAARFRQAGLVPLGRTNTPELALMGTTEPKAHGVTRNPWDVERSPGGSSGGSSAAVAAGLVPAAHANDGAGSIRIPASCCGLVGLKPSRGRVSAGPGPESLGAFAAEGVVARSVRDVAGLLDAVSGPMTGDPFPAPRPSQPWLTEMRPDPGTLRIGITARAPSGVPVNEECADAVGSTAELLEDLGHHVSEAAPEALFDPALHSDSRVRGGANVAAQLDAWSERIGVTIGADDVEPLTWFIAEAGRQTSAPALAAALSRLQVLSRRIIAWWDHFDLLLTPTLAVPTPPLGWFHEPSDPGAAQLRSGQTITFTQPFNVTGQPAVSLPLHTDARGMPLGVQFVAAPHREDVLFRIAAQLEQAHPWVTRRPEPPT